MHSLSELELRWQAFCFVFTNQIYILKPYPSFGSIFKLKSYLMFEVRVWFRGLEEQVNQQNAYEFISKLLEILIAVLDFVFDKWINFSLVVG